jgi:hypothetical protein
LRFKNNGSVERSKENLNAQQEVHHRRIESPKNAMTPEQVIRHYRSNEGAERGGKELAPLYQCFFISFPEKKELP